MFNLKRLVELFIPTAEPRHSLTSARNKTISQIPVMSSIDLIEVERTCVKSFIPSPDGVDSDKLVWEDRQEGQM